MYSIWQDLDPKKLAGAKIADAIAAYAHRFGCSPNVVLVNADEAIDAAIEGVTLRSVSWVRRSNFYVGFEDGAGNASELVAR